MSGATAYAELLVRLSPHDGHGPLYVVESRFSRPGTDAYTEPDAGQARFDLAALDALRDEPEAYGAALTQALFADPTVRTSYEQAVAVSSSSQVPLRLRLSIDVDDELLHAIRWELLHDPLTGGGLATSERILFSRYLRSGDMRPVQRRPKSELRVVVLVASPTDLGAWAPEGTRLEPLDVEAELSLATRGLGDLPVTRLVGKGQATLDRLIAELRQGCDIVYLVCHGAFVKNRALLYLEDEEGNVDVVSGLQLAGELARLVTVPRLVVLASCQSAGSGQSGALSAIGPLLAREGVPSVLAMQGKISTETAGRFMARFFQELGTDGQIDRAVAVARGEVGERPDAWMPVLFTRLNSGRIWTVPAVLSGRQFEPWDALLDMIAEGNCMPILGPGLTEFLLGSQQEIAQRWADTYRFPMAAHVRRDLPQVAQYLAVTQRDPQFPRRQLQKYLVAELRKRHPEILGSVGPEATLDELFRRVGAARRQADPSEPFHVLAQLPLKTYITTNPDNLMSDALAEAGRPPAVDLFQWTQDTDAPWPVPIDKREPDFLPSPQRPLVYHLFGQLGLRDTVVLTEDDYFDYMAGINRQPVPHYVSRAWIDNTLLFLGFRVDDWHFRVLFHSIMHQEGSSRRRQKPHVAVQLDLEDGGSMDPERARSYLERYFESDYINIYWGTSEQFISELWARWQPTVAQTNGLAVAGQRS